MKQSVKMQEKEKSLAAIGWKSFVWTQEYILMGRAGTVCRVDKHGRTKYLRQDEVDLIIGGNK